MKNAGTRILLPILLILIGAGFIYWMNHLFDTSETFRGIFSTAQSSEVLGRVDPENSHTLAMRDETFARISMLLFAVITVMQFCAFGLAFAIVSGIKKSRESFKLRLKQLENADIFFDVPLYVGLFGTVSAFLVMNFSPQSSRVIAYSSTLIGILFCLVLRVIMLYPLRKKLLSGNELNGSGEK